MIRMTRFGDRKQVYVAAADIRRVTEADDGDGAYVLFADGAGVRTVESAQEIVRLVDLEVANGRR